jgi:hypothetical protein
VVPLDPDASLLRICWTTATAARFVTRAAELSEALPKLTRARGVANFTVKQPQLPSSLFLGFPTYVSHQPRLLEDLALPALLAGPQPPPAIHRNSLALVPQPPAGPIRRATDPLPMAIPAPVCRAPECHDAPLIMTVTSM